LVILNLSTGDFFSLENPVSNKIWEDLMAGKTVGAIVEELSQQYAGEEPAMVARTTDEFVADLIQSKLICPRPKSGV
jgi:molybdopterin converting factor small subunit